MQRCQSLLPVFAFTRTQRRFLFHFGWPIRSIDGTAVALCIRKYVSDGALLKQNLLQPSLPTGVIVAESYTRAREALADLLRCDGHRAFEANAETALFAINSNTDAGVLLLDLDMANWKTILNHAQTRIPGIFVIGMRGSEPVPPDLEESGIRVCFKKPLSYRAISQAISAR